MANFNVGFVIFPDLISSTLQARCRFLARLPQATTHIVAKSEVSVPSDCGLSLVPDPHFRELSTA